MSIETVSSASVGMKGRYKLCVLDANRQVVREIPWFDNLITDIGLDRVGSGGVLGTFCRIGTGTTTPAVTDTALVSQVASTDGGSRVSNASTNSGSPNYQTVFTTVYEFALGAVVGNMAEVGVGWSASTAATLFSRARILDGGGSPTTLTVTSGEILQVTYQLALYPGLTDLTGTVTISGVNYDYIARLVSAGAISGGGVDTMLGSGNPSVVGYDGVIGTITDNNPAGANANMSGANLGAYTAGTYYRDSSISAGLTTANFGGGIRSIVIIASQNFSRTQIQFTPAIPKNNTNVLTIPIRISWARR